MLSVLEYAIESDPENALYRSIYALYTNGDMEPACKLLEQHFPKGRLPTSADQCKPYRYMHGNPKDWKPCPDEGLTHQGTDFNIVAALILGKLDGN